MKVVIELSEKEINQLEEVTGSAIENEEDAEYCIHTLIRECM